MHEIHVPRKDAASEEHALLLAVADTFPRARVVQMYGDDGVALVDGRAYLVDGARGSFSYHLVPVGRSDRRVVAATQDERAGTDIVEIEVRVTAWDVAEGVEGGAHPLAEALRRRLAPRSPCSVRVDPDQVRMVIGGERQRVLVPDTDLRAQLLAWKIGRSFQPGTYALLSLPATTSSAVVETGDDGVVLIDGQVGPRTHRVYRLPTDPNDDRVLPITQAVAEERAERRRAGDRAWDERRRRRLGQKSHEERHAETLERRRHEEPPEQREKRLRLARAYTAAWRAKR